MTQTTGDRVAMHFFRATRRVIVALAVVTLASAATATAVIAYPEPLYAYHVEAGRLALYSDRPFDPDKGRLILADVDRRLATAPAGIADPDSAYRIFVSNEEWRRRGTFLWNYGAGGVNYYPIAGSIFIRQADIDHDRLFSSDGAHVPAPRTLAYYGGHEIAHSLIGRKVGAIANWRLPVWIRDGLADYVGFGGDVDIDALTAQLRSGDRDLDPRASGLYARYRLLVAYFLEREGWDVDALLASNLPQDEAERLLLAGVPE
jgi:hypothetical protein